MVLYDFYADWCQPCKMMNPILDQLEQDRPDIEVVRINADASPETCQDYGVTGIPTYIIFDEGIEVKRVIGALPKAKFLTALGIV
jgi:thioredoxin 1